MIGSAALNRDTISYNPLPIREETQQTILDPHDMMHCSVIDSLLQLVKNFIDYNSYNSRM